MKRPASSCWPSDDILKDPWKPQLGRVGKEEEEGSGPKCEDRRMCCPMFIKEPVLMVPRDEATQRTALMLLTER